VKVFFVATAIAVAGFVTQAAQAQTQSVGVNASATVSTACTVTTNPITFGEVSQSGDTNTNAILSATCTNGGAYALGIDNGLNELAGQRRLTSGSNALNYDLFRDPGHVERWGNTVGVDTIDDIGSGLAQNQTIWGEIPAGQTLISGNGTPYTDVVQVAITY
jgi:spore coat protein U-like protein